MVADADRAGGCATLFTAGYEGRAIEAFVAMLVERGVAQVLDVRELPLSRRKGFSKTALGEALASKGIAYVHMREAGNPYRALKDDTERCLALFREHLDAHPEVVAQVEAAVDAHRTVLLCFEGDARCCHRSVIVERLTARRPGAWQVVDL